MGDMFNANPAKLEGCGKQFGDFSTRVTEIQAKASAAVVPAVSWGLIGQPIAWTAYQSMMDDFSQFMEEMAQGVSHVGNHLKGCADTYRQTDATVQQSAKQLHKDLDAAGDSIPTVGGN
ncbi:hypothetical protein F0L68_37910 [Solihabitans fulvus]|uniref:Excreted virulence factor EspC, type VII ESX diderm n=1 Tax=Solihabitans fulvus TaxID=1892852 RepID=A0A5B2WKI1_9PSEU|nr:hypothetical protein [Solihabitans fulvus]KAA2251202.1 hypothetical protein F0L68_37910 [Solihabitans fulvus]